MLKANVHVRKVKDAVELKCFWQDRNAAVGRIPMGLLLIKYMLKLHNVAHTEDL